MKMDGLRKLLMLGENQSVEFKATCRIDVVCRHVCGFLNSGGGYVICGVGDRGGVVGIRSEEEVAPLRSQLGTELSPKALVSVEIQKVNGKEVAVVEVPSGKDIPYAYRNEVFIRVGESTRKADIATIKDMVLRRQVEPERWERRFSSADLETDLDRDEIRRTTESVLKSSRLAFRDEGSLLGVLEDLAVVKYGRLTNGGDVLFAQNPAIRHPQVRVRAACFSRDKTDDTFRDMKSLAGPLGRVLEQVSDFISRNTSTVSTFPRNELRRRDEPLYPSEAIREGLINAFAHRDYADSSGGIAVHVYPSRLEIWNSGGLPAGITPDSLKKGHLSVLRNPDVAHVLYLQGFMEKLGRGSIMILKACKGRNLPAPTWASDKEAGVTLTFYAPKATQQAALQVTQQVALQVTQQVKRLLEVLKGELTRAELMGVLDLKDRVNFSRRYLEPALEAELIEMTQPDAPNSPTQRYRLTEAGRQAGSAKGRA